MSCHLVFRFFWKDSRVGVKEGVLKGTDEYLVLVKNEDYDKLWLPDIFIDQAIDIRCALCIVKRNRFDFHCSLPGTPATSSTPPASGSTATAWSAMHSG